MKRNAIKYLYQWKASNDRKPLIMLGARQVGKTWLMQEFAKEAYTRSAYVNFEDNEMLREVFAHDFDIPRIIRNHIFHFHRIPEQAVKCCRLLSMNKSADDFLYSGSLS